jgi:DNA-binding response OmpR family regulator
MTQNAAAANESLPPIVLLLDDEPDILDMYATHFEAEGVWIATGASALEGMTAVEELRPDLIITDIGFGSEPSGLTFVQALKERADTVRIPLIILSGLPVSDVPPDVRHEADLFLRKPVAPDALLLDVHRVLESASLLADRLSRARGRLEHLRATSNDLRGRLQHATTIPKPPTRRCPRCNDLLSWVDRGSIAGREFDYFDWCAGGCGLHCYDLGMKVWLRLA